MTVPVQRRLRQGAMSILQWEKKFELGVPEFDEHHKHLVELLNEVYRSAVQKENRETLDRVARELIHYTGYHFQAEERAMTECGYPGLAQHREEHEKFAEMAAAFQHELVAGHDITVDLLSFLGNWLFDHILTVDAEYGHSLRQSKGK